MKDLLAADTRPVLRQSRAEVLDLLRAADAPVGVREAEERPQS